MAASKDNTGKTVITLVLIAGGALVVYYLLQSQNTAAAPVYVAQPQPSQSSNVYGLVSKYLPSIVNAL